MWKDYLFEFVGEDSDNFGERFFLELFIEDDTTEKDIITCALDLFPGEELTYLGEYSVEEAEELGYDTY